VRLDVQGGEFDVLTTAAAQLERVVKLELNPYLMRVPLLGDLGRFLHSRGFALSGD
jgi:hypothetical protein